jgi:hypothetical protein
VPPGFHLMVECLFRCQMPTSCPEHHDTGNKIRSANIKRNGFFSVDKAPAARVR